ncbi:MAG: lmo0937 family membrane protein [Candidatus Jorgensenbacteria bacterium]|nr:lmo0937 family membrane protein [Candidatus Jorgensenbacteria bacterium]
MLLTIGLVLIALWLIGFIIFPVMGWLIHILLLIAVIVILVRIIRGK